MDKVFAQNLFKFTVIFGGGYLMFKALVPKPRKSTKIGGDMSVVELSVEERAFITPPPLMDEAQAQSNPKAAEAHLALSVYIDAMNSGISTQELNDVNS